MSKTFLLFTTLLLVAFLQASSSTHLKTKVQKTRYDQKGLCFIKLWQTGVFRIGSSENSIFTKHGQCKELNYVGDSLNDDTDMISFSGDCNTCSVQVFDDANLQGGSKTFQRKDCNWAKNTCELNDWDDRISSVKLCCDKDPKIDYRYGEPWHKICSLRFRQDKWLDPKYLDSMIYKGRCDEKSNVGKDFNDNINQIHIGDQCLDCTVQLFDDADFKGDSKIIKIGSNECPITYEGIPKCDLGGWKDRVSSYKVCCPTSIV